MRGVLRASVVMAATACVAVSLLPVQSTGVESDQSTLEALQEAAAGSHRSDENKARDRYRHPVETLAWFGIRDSMTVVELTPGGGWYTEILAPFLRERGKLYAAGYDPDSKEDYYRNSAKRFREKLAAQPAIYDKVEVTFLQLPDKLDIAPEGSADLVVTFRNFHNWMEEKQAERVLAAAFRALKPGGIFGLVEHRENPAAVQDLKAASGYVKQDIVIAMAQAVGFELQATSEINANPADDRDHPEGVWTLPPSLALEDVDREKYLAIGESDRMTLRFVKPGKS